MVLQLWLNILQAPCSGRRLASLGPTGKRWHPGKAPTERGPWRERRGRSRGWRGAFPNGNSLVPGGPAHPGHSGRRRAPDSGHKHPLAPCGLSPSLLCPERGCEERVSGAARSGEESPGLDSLSLCRSSKSAAAPSTALPVRTSPGSPAGPALGSRVVLADRALRCPGARLSPSLMQEEGLGGPQVDCHSQVCVAPRAAVCLSPTDCQSPDTPPS